MPQPAPHSVLKLRSLKNEAIYDNLDTNALIFHLSDSDYFTVQRSVYLEDDPALNEAFFELNDQGNAQAGGMEKLIVSPTSLEWIFAPNEPFIGQYPKITIHLPAPTSEKMVDFLVNHLFFGDQIEYTPDFPEKLKIRQTQWPEPL